MTDLVAVARKAAEGISAGRHCRAQSKPGKRAWYRGYVEFREGKEDQAIQALVSDARHRRFSRFLIPVAHFGAQMKVVRSGGVAVRATAQYFISHDETRLWLDYIGARA